ncbi:MAG: pyruvate kinase [Rhodothermia bacterium]|nr:MAG: pyruvate kinase [Rhodothermia bacterium]
MRRRTKIVCTLGPASSDAATIRALVQAGMDVARLNLSHGTHEFHGQMIERVREAARLERKVVPLLLDLQGPKIRVGEVRGGRTTLVTGSRVVISTGDSCESTAERIFVAYPTLSQDVSVGNSILIDDGALELKVLETGNNEVVAEVITGGELSSKKGIHLPNIRTSTPSLTEKDLSDLEFGLSFGADLIALSFVRDEKDVANLLRLTRGAEKPPLILAKIEKPEAVNKIDQIIDTADAIMVARGDLGIEMELSRVPGTQKLIIRKCLGAAKPVITATQMFESMIENPRPTRAEVSDVANAVLDGTDAVMLSGETAVGNYPVQCVEVMSRVIEEAESDYTVHASQIHGSLLLGVTDAVSRTATQLAVQVNATAIACLTASGRTARSIASHRPKIPVYGFTDNETVVGQLALTWGTKGFHIPFQPDTDKGIELVHEVLKKEELVADGDTVVITAGMPLPAKGRTNMVHVSCV